MALVECPDCGASVSTAAVACPSCGRPTPEIGSSTRKTAVSLEFIGAGSLVAGLVLLFVLLILQPDGAFALLVVDMLLIAGGLVLYLVGRSRKSKAYSRDI